ncbi:MFS transporter [Clostridium gasigenes]|uniref:MFS transporter n=1 Tax=Clostridium gasigenes TaxID=94869 RepID=UPI001C0C1B4B|nr:MFS transporter [Clostridium gasigenes]
MENKIDSKKIGRMVVLASGLAVFCLFGFRSSFSVLQGPMAKDLGWSSSSLTLGYSLMMTVYAITAFFSGMIIDKYGTRPAYAIGSVCAGLGFFITSFAQSYLGYLIPYVLFAGIGTGMLWVSSTVSVRKWYVGKSYASMWGIAFMGAPIAQVLLSLGLKPILLNMDWRVGMRVLSLIVFVALVIAAVISKKNPENYGLEAFGIETVNVKKSNKEWTVTGAFKTFPIWGAVLAFLGSMIGEFLIWTQIVNYWVIDSKLSLGTATNLYVCIGIAGIFTMPLLGKVSDKLVGRLNNETLARKNMLILAPVLGIVACILLITTQSKIFAIISCIIFASYWAIEPGGVAGYAGSLYGGKTFGRIWGMATLIVMGIGPALGSFTGAYLFDKSGSYLNSILFAMGAFIFSLIFAIALPLKVKEGKSTSEVKVKS